MSSNIKLKPIIKWTGGKYNEFAFFSDYIPVFDRYIEPFFGGGGVFFALQPNVTSLINDKSEDLINFYKQIHNPEFKNELFKYADFWEEMGVVHNEMWDSCSTYFINFIKGKIEYHKFNERFQFSLFELTKSNLILNHLEFIINPVLFKETVISSIADKAKRIKKIYEKDYQSFNQKNFKDHFETGLKSGAYLFFRRILNLSYHQSTLLEPPKSAANWYFVRELCYGSMFRFNAKGEFNIPYGGIAYNRKNFRKKAKNIINLSTSDLFKSVVIYNLDFENFLKNIELKATDFIFLDPPYDSEFSEYDQNAFTKNDQQRLASFLINCNSRWMMVIKETDFIRTLYTQPNVNIITFDKKYTYNVRGRNDRAVRHLIIRNY